MRPTNGPPPFGVGGVRRDATGPERRPRHERERRAEAPLSEAGPGGNHRPQRPERPLALTIEYADGVTVDGFTAPEYPSTVVFTTTVASVAVLTLVLAALETGLVF